MQTVRYDKIASVRQSCVAALLSLQRLAALHNRSDLAELPLESARPCPRLTPRDVRWALGDDHHLRPLTFGVTCLLLRLNDNILFRSCSSAWPAQRLGADDTSTNREFAD